MISLPLLEATASGGSIDVLGFALSPYMLVWYVWICGMIIGVVLSSLYWFSWGNVFMRAYMKTVMSRGKKQFGILLEGHSGYYQTVITDFSPQLINEKYLNDPTKVRHVRYWVATVPFAIANAESNLLADLRSNDILVDKTGKPITVSSDSIQIAAQNIIEYERRKARVEIFKMVMLMLAALIILSLVILVLGYLTYSNSGTCASASNYTATEISKLVYTAQKTGVVPIVQG